MIQIQSTKKGERESQNEIKQINLFKIEQSIQNIQSNSKLIQNSQSIDDQQNSFQGTLHLRLQQNMSDTPSKRNQ